MDKVTHIQSNSCHYVVKECKRSISSQTQKWVLLSRGFTTTREAESTRRYMASVYPKHRVFIISSEISNL